VEPGDPPSVQLIRALDTRRARTYIWHSRGESANGSQGKALRPASRLKPNTIKEM